MKKNRKPLIAMVALLVVGLVGVTFAYFSDSITFDNVFRTGVYRTVTTENFDSPVRWTPGDITTKTITTRNDGDYPVAVRISYTESWVKGDEILDGELLDENNDPIGQRAAVLNLANTSDWVKSGNYYYYNKPLDPNYTTSSWLSSVAFNENADASWADAEYTLSVKVETVQFDAYQDEWNTSYTIPEN